MICKSDIIDFPESTCSLKRRAEYLLVDDHMKGLYLGPCLDSCRWGSYTTVMYEMTIRELITFILSWMKQNKENYQNLFHKNLHTHSELPYTDHAVCPSDKNHQDTIQDQQGKLRCANREIKRFKPNYFDNYKMPDQHFSGMEKTIFYENPPSDPLPNDAWDKRGNLKLVWKETADQYQRELEKFDEEEELVEVIDICYAILSDKNLILPFETIMKRLNLRPEKDRIYCPGLSCTSKRFDEMSDGDKIWYSGVCPGHDVIHHYTEFPFDGWKLASYVQKWIMQKNDGTLPPIYD